MVIGAKPAITFWAASVFASALFLGSALVIPHNTNIAYGGFIASAGDIWYCTGRDSEKKILEIRHAKRGYDK